MFSIASPHFKARTCPSADGRKAPAVLIIEARQSLASVSGRTSLSSDEVWRLRQT